MIRPRRDLRGMAGDGQIKAAPSLMAHVVVGVDFCALAGSARLAWIVEMQNDFKVQSAGARIVAYRGVALLAFSLILILSFGAWSSAATVPPSSAAPPVKSVPPVPTRTVSKPQPAEPGCGAPRSDPKSELCAQWKAADAAEASVTWARRAFWAGVVSLGFLLVTLWQARCATIETRRIGQEQTRAYLAVIAATAEIRDDGPLQLGTPKITLSLSNSGSTPATKISYFCGASVIKVGEQSQFICATDLPYLTILPNIAANGAREISAMCQGMAPALQEVDRLWQEVNDDTPIGQMPCAVVWGAVIYDDVFGQTFRSDFAFLLDDHDNPNSRPLSLVQALPMTVVGGAAPLTSRLRVYEPFRFATRWRLPWQP